MKMPWGYTRQVLILCLLASSLTCISATQASERQSQSVELTFYQLTPSEWSSSLSSFKSAVATEAETYCTSNAATCGLSSGFLFDENEVGVSSGPTEESKSLKVSIYIDFPTVHVLDSSSSTTYVVNSAAVTTILTNIRNNLESVVGADITYIEDEFYSIDPDSTLNKVLIPIAFIVLLGIVILAIALHMWDKRKELEAKKKQRALDREKRKKTSRISPVYTMETEVKQSAEHWLRRSRKKKTPKAPNSRALNSNGNVPTLSMKTNMLTYDGSGAASKAGPEGKLQSEDPVPLRNNALPPLPNPASEEETKEKHEERKREKKEKKRRKHEKRPKKESGEEGREETEDEYSKTESLENNVIPVEDEPQVVA